MSSWSCALLLALLAACGRSHGAGRGSPREDAAVADAGQDADLLRDATVSPELCADREVLGPIATFDVGDETDLELIRVLGIPGDLASMLTRSRAVTDGTPQDVLRYWIVGSGGRPVTMDWLGEPPQSIVGRGTDLRADATWIGHEFGKTVVVGRERLDGELLVWVRWRDRGIWSERVELARFPAGSVGAPTLIGTATDLDVYWSRDGELERRAFDFDAMSLGEPEPLDVAVGPDDALVTRTSGEVVCISVRDPAGESRLIEVRGGTVSERVLRSGATRALEPTAMEGECVSAAPVDGVVPVPGSTAGWTLPTASEPFLLDLDGRPTSLLVGTPDGERAAFWWVDAPESGTCRLGEPTFDAALPPPGTLPVAGSASSAIPFGDLLFLLGAERPNGITTFLAEGDPER